MIEVTAYAPDRETGIAFMQAVGIATLTDGQIVPVVEAQFTSTDDGWATGKPGWFVNDRYYGQTAEALMTGGNPDSPDLFERAPGLLAITEARTGEPMVWTALSTDPIPPGYQNSDGVRLYDPSLIATRSNVWA